MLKPTLLIVLLCALAVTLARAPRHHRGFTQPAAAATITFGHSGQVCTASSCTITTGQVLGNAASNAIAANLPVATGTYNPYEICKTDSSANVVTVTPNGTDKIYNPAGNALTSYPLSYQNDCIRIVDQASASWAIISTSNGEPLGIPPDFAGALGTASPELTFNLIGPINFAADFGGGTLSAHCKTSPSETDDYLVYCGATQIGDVSVSTASPCVATPSTVSHVAKTCASGSYIRILGPATISGSDVSFTLPYFRH